MMVGQPVAPHCQQDVRDHQQHDVGAEPPVPRRQPVQPDGAFQHRNPSHQQHLDEHQVGSEQTADPPECRRDRRRAVQAVRRGAGPPEPHHDEAHGTQRGPDQQPRLPPRGPSGRPVRPVPCRRRRGAARRAWPVHCRPRGSGPRRDPLRRQIRSSGRGGVLCGGIVPGHGHDGRRIAGKRRLTMPSGDVARLGPRRPVPSKPSGVHVPRR